MVSEETRKKQSDAQKRLWAEGRGNSPFVKGHEVKQEWIDAGRKANIGSARHITPHSDETKKNISENRKGKGVRTANGNWKGGITSEDKKLRNYFRKTLQKQIFERDSYTCTICLNQGGCLHVDHIKRWVDYPELRFDMNNCRTLCKKCHYKITFGTEMPNPKSPWGHNLNQGGVS